MGTDAPVRLPQAAKLRAVLRAIVANFPEILIVNMAIWVAAVAAILSFSGMVPGPLIGLPVFAFLFGVPAIWASWQTIKLAMTPQDLSRPAPPPTDSE